MTTIQVKRIDSNDFSSFTVNKSYANLRDWLEKKGYPRYLDLDSYDGYYHHMNKVNNKPNLKVRFV